MCLCTPRPPCNNENICLKLFLMQLIIKELFEVILLAGSPCVSIYLSNLSKHTSQTQILLSRHETARTQATVTAPQRLVYHHLTYES
jgi:hypothetical protein